MQKVKISTFLTERKERMSPNDANNSGLSRIEKINFSGEFFINESKQTNTWMIVVYPNDLVISGINVAKWCLGIYKGDEKVLATIHYSCYEYDLEKIDLEYLKRFVKSSVFQNTILEQTKWWIKTEIKAKTFLNLEITLPSIEQQKLIVQKLERFNIQDWDLSDQINKSSNLIKSLRQSILSDAIAGKLVPQDPSNELASVLLQKIQAEKAQLIADWKLKKSKPLAPISENEKPFALPVGWEWVRLWEICTKITDGFHNTPPKLKQWWFPYIAATQVNDWWIDRNTWSFVEEKYHRELYTKAYPKRWEILVVNIWAWCWSPAIIDIDYEFSFKNTAILKFNQDYIYNQYLLYFLLLSKNWFYTELTQWWAQPFLSLTILNNIIFPLAPLAEQHRIVAKVDALMQLCDQLEAQITDTQSQGKLLMEAVMQQAMGT
jgi:type I restriction enzyme S subunit